MIKRNIHEPSGFTDHKTIIESIICPANRVKFLKHLKAQIQNQTTLFESIFLSLPACVPKLANQILLPLKSRMFPIKNASN